MRRTLQTAALIALVLSALAGVAATRPHPQYPRRSITLAASGGLPHFTGWQHSTTTTVPPQAPQRPTGATVSQGAPQPQKPRATPVGGGSCDRPSTCPQLRQCENGGSYSAGTSPQFYGAYQFADRSTWGMSPSQQDAHADQMYAQRGAQPWPVCGRFLR